MTKEALEIALEALEGKYSITASMLNQQFQALTAIKEALVLAQPAREPVAWISTGPAKMIHWTPDKPAYGDDWVPLYTTPPQRPWVGLTQEEVEQFHNWKDCTWSTNELVRYVEATLRSKNT